MRRLKPFLLSLAFIIADQLTKAWVVATIPEGSVGYSFLGGFLRIVHVRNDAVAFSLGSSFEVPVKIVLFILLPMLLIILQRETGSALVYLAFFLMLYREGMPGVVLFAGLCAVIYFVVGIRFGDTPLPGTLSTVGPFAVLILILLFSAGLMLSSGKPPKPVRRAMGIAAGALTAGLLVSKLIVPFNVEWVLLALCLLLTGYQLYLALSERQTAYLVGAFFTLCSVGFLYSSDYVFHRVLEPHQQVRIQVVLGMEEDPTGAGYNVNQSKIAIGSGGLTGKGFLNGTQTKLKYVPEQDTDFIFCTVGEEEGFLGSTAVLLLYLGFLLRLLQVAERQPTTFGRVYGYCVLSIFFFHLFINVGMVLGLTPVIGIPLPFFSYGGSSLWGFTLPLFIFLRIDAARGRMLR